MQGFDGADRMATVISSGAGLAAGFGRAPFALRSRRGCAWGRDICRHAPVRVRPWRTPILPRPRCFAATFADCRCPGSGRTVPLVDQTVWIAFHSPCRTASAPATSGFFRLRLAGLPRGDAVDVSVPAPVNRECWQDVRLIENQVVHLTGLICRANERVGNTQTALEQVASAATKLRAVS